MAESSEHPLRVLHCPKLIGGHAALLARAERAAGLASWAVAFHPARFHLTGDEILVPDRSKHFRREIARWRLLWRAIRRFDVIHFSYGESLMPLWAPDEVLTTSLPNRLVRLAYRTYAKALELRDLRLLKRLGKAIVVTYQGSDARQGEYCREHFAISPAGEVDARYFHPAFDRHKAWRIARFDKYADLIFSLNPDLLHVLPARAKFLPYANVDLADWRPLPATGNKVPLVLHAPSHRGVKGTRFILDAVSRLKAEGVEFDFALVENLPRDQARRLYERADLMVDQLLVGWYGGAAVEMMALAKPVIAYIRPEDLKFIPSAMAEEVPVINAAPASIYDVLRQHLTAGRVDLAARGVRGRAFVERWHDPTKIAADLKRHYESVTRRPGEMRDGS